MKSVLSAEMFSISVQLWFHLAIFEALFIWKSLASQRIIFIFIYVCISSPDLRCIQMCFPQDDIGILS